MKKKTIVMMSALLLITCVGCSTVKVVDSPKPTASTAPAASAKPSASAAPQTSTAPQTSAKPAAAGKYVPGTYETTVKGMGGSMKVAVTFDANSLVSVKVTEHQETENIGTRAIEVVIPAMIKAQSTSVDAYSGATVTSDALKLAVNNAIKMATPK